MALTTLTATILATRSVSAAVDLSALQVVAIISPPAWTGGAPVSFDMSPDGVTFYNVALSHSTQVNQALLLPNSWTPVLAANFPKGVFLKIRSGHPSSPVVQTADRVFTLVGTP